MAINNRRGRVGYGLSDALPNIPNPPIVSERSPTTGDKAPIGTFWVDKPNNDSYILTSIVANSATWINTGGGSGTFASITVDPGDIDIVNGDLDLQSGDLDLAVGDITVDLGDVTVTAGDIVVTAGSVFAGQLYATGDIGGLIGTTSLTNVTDDAQSTGTLSIVSKSANNGNNTGFFKFYVAGTPAFVPYFTSISP